MTNVFRLFLLVTFLIIIDLNWIQACTTFCLGDGNRPVYGRNFDWRIGGGQIIINKRGVAKEAISNQQNSVSNSLSWVSKYGSASFNLFGREFPLGGMNEAGLVIESLQLDETQYPPKDSRPEIMVSQWIQYQLDNFSRIEEVIESDSNIRIQASRDSKLHFFICERSGECTTVEFIGGKLVAHTNESMPVKTLTNSAYGDSLGYWRKGVLPEIDQNRSIERFIRSANMVKGYDSDTAGDPIVYAFTILDSVEHDSFITQWSIVYDILNLTINFRTHGNEKIRYFDLKSFDLSCSTPVQVIDIEAEGSGNITAQFIDYSYQTNRNHIRNIYRQSYFSTPPDYILDKLSGYPGTTTCNE